MDTGFDCFSASARLWYNLDGHHALALAINGQSQLWNEYQRCGLQSIRR